jgi:hypothetical protein
MTVRATFNDFRDWVEISIFLAKDVLATLPERGDLD